jgi:hypothetical protein
MKLIRADLKETHSSQKLLMIFQLAFNQIYFDYYFLPLESHPTAVWFWEASHLPSLKLAYINFWLFFFRFDRLTRWRWFFDSRNIIFGWILWKLEFASTSSRYLIKIICVWFCNWLLDRWCFYYRLSVSFLAHFGYIQIINENKLLLSCYLSINYEAFLQISSLP